jgi:hypothetical protein
MTASLLTPDHELTPAQWLRRFATSRMAYHADSDKLLQVADLLEQTEQVRDLLGQHLEKIASVIKGAPPPGTLWGFEDLPELCEQLMAKTRPDGAGVH